MQYTTEEYREEMRKPYRGASHIWVYVGLINEAVQRSAHIVSSFSGDETYIYDSTPATTGVTSTENDGHIEFEFDGYENNIAGFTITFGTIPDHITITNGDKTALYGVDEAEITIDDGYTNCHSITITPSSGKLNIKSITFGIGLQFTDTQLINTLRENTVNHIANELPTKKFSFVVNNRLLMFNKDNPYGYSNFLQEKQEVVYEYGRTMPDNSIYKIKGGKVLLKSWSSDDYQAKFTCVGRLDYLNGTYYKGQYYEDGKSAREVAQDVLSDAGVTDYVLDPSLARIQIFNPIPVCSHKEALQMIANACRCTLFEDRDGNICIRSAYTPSYVKDVTFTGATAYCIPSSLFDGTSLNYADAEYNYVKADGSTLFIAENGNYVGVGFVSSQLANSSGLFTNNPHIDVTLQSEYHMIDMFLTFSLVPTSITVALKYQGVTVDTQTVTPSVSTTISYDGTIDAFTVTFNGAVANQRIHLNSIEMNGFVDYELTYHELKDTPVATSLDKVADLTVHHYQYSKELEQPEDTEKVYMQVNNTVNVEEGLTININTVKVVDNPVATAEAVVGDNVIILNDPCYDLYVNKGEIVEQGAYYVVVNSPTEDVIEVYGKRYIVADNALTVNIHEKGVSKNSTNPLISNLIMAQQQAGWLSDFYDDDIEYTFTYRGDPTLDADDEIYIENHFVDKNAMRIEEETISTSLGMDFACKITGRRTYYQVEANVGDMIIGRMEVGE